MKRMLIANRCEIACRIIRTAREMGIDTVAVYSDPDRCAAHVSLADRAFPLGGDTSASSYLSVAKLLEAARQGRADAIHPGYGFLAENADFARAVESAGMVFVGPTPDAIETMGDKLHARELAGKAGLPLLPSATVKDKQSTDSKAAAKLGFPILVKAVAGGGGRGMRVVRNKTELTDAVAAARREAAAAFGDGRVYLEKYIADPRHIEVQVFGDGRGNVVDVGERECSVQRRHQKIIEETPSPFVSTRLRERLCAAALELAKAINYRGAGTVEFIVDQNSEFYFLEMNTRLQVEHAVTEMTASVDLVAWQLEVASGGGLPRLVNHPRGHAIECRVYAEDPAAGFVPTAGRVLRVEHPTGPGIRVDSALFDGWEIPIEYDPMLAKVIAWGSDRAQALGRMRHALSEFLIVGIDTNIRFLIDVIDDPLFAQGGFTTNTIEQHYHDWKPSDGQALSVATTAAALLMSSTPSLVTSSAAGGNKTTLVGPWQTLGGWCMGRAGVNRGD